MTVASLDHHGRKVVLRWRIASLVSGRSLLLGPFFYLPRGEGNGILANLVFAQWTTAEVAILGMVALHVNDYEIFHVGLSRSNRKIKGEIGEMFCCAAIQKSTSCPKLSFTRPKRRAGSQLAGKLFKP
jgi:hypothetical protein